MKFSTINLVSTKLNSQVYKAEKMKLQKLVCSNREHPNLEPDFKHL
jgi:hypothetical protein